METANRRMAAQKMSAIPKYAEGGAIPMRLKKPSKPGAASVMAEGGNIQGPGTGTSDDIPIMASNGEYVIRAAAVEEVGTEVLDAINALGEDRSTEDDPEDKVPGKYSTGGVINKYGTEIPNTPEQQQQLANQTASYVTGAQAANPPKPAVQTMAAPPVAAPVQSDYARQMGEVGNFFADGAATALKTLVSAPGYGFNKPSAPQTAVAQAQPAATQAQPAAAPALAKPAMPAAPQARPGAPNPASGSPDEVMRDGKVNVSIQPNGVKSFSGKNISGQPEYTGSAANTMKSGVMNSVPGMSQETINKTLTNPDGSRWSTRDNAIMAANIRDGVDPYRGTAQGQANDLRALALSPNGTPGKSNAMKMLAMQSEEKRATGQQQIEKDRNAQQSKGTELDNQAKQQVLQAQQELANAKTPAEEAAAEKKLRALQGKYGKEAPAEQYAFAPGGQSIDPVTGQAVTQPGVIVNKATGEIKQPGQTRSIEADPRAIAIRDNKTMTREQKLAELKKMGYQ
jgi:hypothetical protein